MCEPTTIMAVAGGMLASKMLAPSAPSMPSQPDPAAQRAQAEADAANAANSTLAESKRVKRANVLATGGSTDALGAGQSAVKPASTTNVLGGGAT
jgi:hypothetical protein